MNNEAFIMRGVLADAERIVKTIPPMRYRLQSADDLLNTPPLRWLVHGVVPSDSFAALFGASGSGKSFLALDLCAAVADGSDWFGRRVTAAPVAYVGLEGGAGLSKRVKAWSEHNRRALPDRLRFITQPLDLRQITDIDDVCAAVLAANGRGGLVVIDTLNRAAPGADENSSKDMGELIGACEEIRRRIGCTVLLVHHTGKQISNGLRGHSSLFAALDAAIEVSRTDSRREWAVAKAKDDADGERYAFTLRIVELGDDEDGEPITSCVVTRDESAVMVERVKLPQGGNQRITMDALAQPLRESRDFSKGDAPLGRPCLELEAAMTIGAAHLTCEATRRNERARTAINGLVSRGVYGSKDGWLWRK